jgi:hypothetical protein
MCIYTHILLNFNVIADMKMSLSVFYKWCVDVDVDVDVDNNWFRALSVLMHLDREIGLLCPTI